MIDFEEPFTGTDAVASGAVTRYQLAHRFTRLHRNVYIAPGIEPTPLLRAKAAWLWAGARGVLVGTSAAAVHGTRWLPPDAPAEIVRDGLLLVRAGLPVPETQVEVFDGPTFVARADLGWRQWRVLIEYDGAHHWTDRNQRTRDIDRYAVLPDPGWTVIRVGADLLYRGPQVLIERVRRALHRAGAPVQSIEKGIMRDSGTDFAQNTRPDVGAYSGDVARTTAHI